jgi:CubicO group peptidase (beta-lactamase class C family)
MLLGRGELDGKRLLDEESVAQMTKNQPTKDAYPIDVGGKRPGVGFGLGFSVIVEKATQPELGVFSASNSSTDLAR